MNGFHLRVAQPPTPPAPKRRYQLEESVNGGAYTPCRVIGGQMESYSPHVLAHWLAARCWYWQSQGYTRLFTAMEAGHG